MAQRSYQESRYELLRTNAPQKKRLENTNPRPISSLLRELDGFIDATPRVPKGLENGLERGRSNEISTYKSKRRSRSYPDRDISESERDLISPSATTHSSFGTSVSGSNTSSGGTLGRSRRAQEEFEKLAVKKRSVLKTLASSSKGKVVSTASTSTADRFLNRSLSRNDDGEERKKYRLSSQDSTYRKKQKDMVGNGTLESNATSASGLSSMLEQMMGDLDELASSSSSSSFKSNKIVIPPRTTKSPSAAYTATDVSTKDTRAPSPNKGMQSIQNENNRKIPPRQTNSISKFPDRTDSHGNIISSKSPPPSITATATPGITSTTPIPLSSTSSSKMGKPTSRSQTPELDSKASFGINAESVQAALSIQDIIQRSDNDNNNKNQDDSINSKGNQPEDSMFFGILLEQAIIDTKSHQIIGDRYDEKKKDIGELTLQLASLHIQLTQEVKSRDAAYQKMNKNDKSLTKENLEVQEDLRRTNAKIEYLTVNLWKVVGKLMEIERSVSKHLTAVLRKGLLLEKSGGERSNVLFNMSPTISKDTRRQEMEMEKLKSDQQKLNSAEARIRELELANTQLKSTITRLEEEKTEAYLDLDAAKSEMKQAQQTSEQLLEQLETLKKSQQMEEPMMDSTTPDGRDIFNSSFLKRSNNSNNKNTTGPTQAEHNRIKLDLATTKAQVMSVQDELEGTRRMLEASTRELEEQTLKLENKEREIVALQSDLEEVTTKLEMANAAAARLAGKESEDGSYGKKLVIPPRTNSPSKSKLASSSDSAKEIKRLEKLLDERERELENERDHIHDLESTISQLKTDLLSKIKPSSNSNNGFGEGHPSTGSDTESEEGRYKSNGHGRTSKSSSSNDSNIISELKRKLRKAQAEIEILSADRDAQDDLIDELRDLFEKLPKSSLSSSSRFSLTNFIDRIENLIEESKLKQSQALENSDLEYKKQIRQLKESERILKSDFEKADRKIQILIDEGDSLKDECNSLTKQLQNLQLSSLNSTTDSNSNSRRYRYEEETKKEEARERQKEQLRQLKEEYENQINELEIQLKDAQRDLERLENDLKEKYADERRELETRHANELKKIKEDHERRFIRDLERAKEDLMDDMSQKLEESKLKLLKAESQAVEAKQKLHEERTRFQDQMDDLTDQLEKAKEFELKALDDQTSRTKEYEIKLDELRRELEESSQKVLFAQEDAKSAARKVEILKSKGEELESVKKELAQVEREFQLELSQLEQERRKLELDLAAERDISHDAKEQIENLKDQLEVLKRELGDARLKAQNNAGLSTEEVAALHVQIDTLLKQKKEFLDVIQDYEQRQNRMEDEMRGLEVVLDRQMANFTDYDFERQKYEKKIEELKVEISILQEKSQDVAIAKLGSNEENPSTAKLRAEFRKLQAELRSEYNAQLQTQNNEKVKLERALRDLKREKEAAAYNNISTGVQTNVRWVNSENPVILGAGIMNMFN